jgi:hypothetical protein
MQSRQNKDCSKGVVTRTDYNQNAFEEITDEEERIQMEWDAFEPVNYLLDNQARFGYLSKSRCRLFEFLYVGRHLKPIHNP